MAIVHILKDGTTVPDIKGHVVKATEAPAIYDLMELINQKQYRKRGKNEKKGKKK